MLTRQQEKDRELQLQRMGLNFKKARLAYEDPRYKNNVPGLIRLVVPDKDGNEQHYECFEHEIPADAKHLLKEK